MAYNIAQYLAGKQVERVRLIVLTDGRMTKNLTALPSESMAGLPIDFRVIDIDYIYRIYLVAFKSQLTLSASNLDIESLVLIIV